MSGFKTRMFALLLLFSLCLLSSCTGQKEESPVESGKGDVPRRVFVVGLLPQQNVFAQKKRYKPLADYLSRSTGMTVKMKLLDSYGAVYNEMYYKKIDAAFFGSLSYVVMDSRLSLDAIARPMRKGSVSSYRGVIFALRDKGITEDVATWKGKRLALVEKSTASGYLFPRWYLKTKGINNFRGYFSDVIFCGTHDASIMVVLDGHADIGCSSDNIFNKFIEKRPSLRGKFVVLAASAPFPADTLAVRQDQDPAVKQKLREALTGMARTEEGRKTLSEFGAERFVETGKADYDPVLDMMKTVGVKPDYFGLESIGKGSPHLPPEADAR